MTMFVYCGRSHPWTASCRVPRCRPTRGRRCRRRRRPRRLLGPPGEAEPPRAVEVHGPRRRYPVPRPTRRRGTDRAGVAWRAARARRARAAPRAAWRRTGRVRGCRSRHPGLAEHRRRAGLLGPGPDPPPSRSGGRPAPAGRPRSSCARRECGIDHTSRRRPRHGGEVGSRPVQRHAGEEGERLTGTEVDRDRVDRGGDLPQDAGGSPPRCRGRRARGGASRGRRWRPPLCRLASVSTIHALQSSGGSSRPYPLSWCIGMSLWVSAASGNFVRN